MYRKHLIDEKLSIILFVFIFVLYVLVVMTKNCYSAAMAAIVHEGVMTKSQTGLINAVFYMVYAPLQIIGGKVADKYVPEKMIAIGLFGSACANFIIYLNQNYIVMILAWAFNAAIQFGLWPSVFKIVSSQLAEVHRSRAVFYISFAFSVGMFLAYLVAIFMERWEHNFLFSAIVLFLLGVILMACFPYLDKHMIEYEATEKPDKKNKQDAINSKDLFFKSGLFVMLCVVLFRTVIEQGTKAIAPTLLMESYREISPDFGNFMSLFIIVAGIVGVIVAKCLYRRHIKDEIKGHIYAFLIIIPFLIAITFVGKINLIVSVISLAVVAMVASGLQLFTSYMTMEFARYGKDGEVAGLLNSSTSIGFIIQTYGIAVISDNFGWFAVTWLWLTMTVLSIIVLLYIYPKWKKFKNGE